MSQHTHLRLVGYTAILVIHITNMFYMDWHTKGLHTEDQRILAFKDLDNRFLTTWTIVSFFTRQLRKKYVFYAHLVRL